MKKFFFLLIVLLSLALFSEVMAENYCTIDDYGCYVFNEDNQLTYIMFWSEAGRKAIMGNIGNPGDLVVDKPTFSSNRLPLGPFEKTEENKSADAPAVDTPCVNAYNYFKGTTGGEALTNNYVTGNAADEEQCQDEAAAGTCFGCIIGEYPTAQSYNDIFSGVCNISQGGSCGTAVDTPCVNAYNYFKGTTGGSVLTNNYVTGNAAHEQQCQGEAAADTCFDCIIGKYPTTDTYNQIASGVCNISQGGACTVDTSCVNAYNYFKGTRGGGVFTNNYVSGNSAHEQQCQDEAAPGTCFGCIIGEYPTDKSYIDIAFDVCHTSKGKQCTPCIDACKYYYSNNPYSGITDYFDECNTYTSGYANDENTCKGNYMKDDCSTCKFKEYRYAMENNLSYFDTFVRCSVCGGG